MAVSDEEQQAQKDGRYSRTVAHYNKVSFAAGLLPVGKLLAALTLLAYLLTLLALPAHILAVSGLHCSERFFFHFLGYGFRQESPQLDLFL